MSAMETLYHEISMKQKAGVEPEHMSFRFNFSTYQRLMGHLFPDVSKPLAGEFSGVPYSLDEYVPDDKVAVLIAGDVVAIWEV